MYFRVSLSLLFLFTNPVLLSFDYSMSQKKEQDQFMHLAIANQSTAKVIALVKTQESNPYFDRIEIAGEQHWGPISVCKNAETSLRTPKGTFLLTSYSKNNEYSFSHIVLNKYPVDESKPESKLRQAIRSLPYNDLASIFLILNENGSIGLTSKIKSLRDKNLEKENSSTGEEYTPSEDTNLYFKTVEDEELVLEPFLQKEEQDAQESNECYGPFGQMPKSKRKLFST